MLTSPVTAKCTNMETCYDKIKYYLKNLLKYTTIMP